MAAGEGHGEAVWSTAAWRDRALAWADDHLAAAGLARDGQVTQPHRRPWATVLRIPTAGGPVWLKACSPGTAAEVGLYEVLAGTVPDRILVPLATDRARRWLLLPDGGPVLGERLEGAALAEALAASLAAYGRMQLDLATHVDDVLAAGVADMRPAALPARFEEALDATAATADPDRHREVAALRPRVAEWCERLGASPVPASLDHNDLHPWNVLGEPDAPRFYDWGDAVVAHSFAATLVPLGFVATLLGTGVEDPRVLAARDAYLAVFGGDGADELVPMLELACRVAKIARTLTWDRAVRAAREQGEELEDRWRLAPWETLSTLDGDGYLGGR
ncbi:MAG TPA: phosphotransferase [Acidimicrobiales bacterium]|nr:phosphotransferase [Acidimicrobiales bacterium]